MLPASAASSTSSDFDGDGVADAQDACLSAAGNAADGCRGDTTVPTVKTWKPTGKKVSPTAKPIVTFSEAMDGGSVEASTSGKPTTFVLKKGATVIPATVSYTESGTTFKAVLTPNKPLKRGATYTAVMTPTATDEAGNTLVPKSWKFRVKP
ncbi:MAG: Ig-like domain-containing protein [Actinomycetota bacterium]|nr:Ig-like domain-containing protein [Actinomycetota bacterium]